jgi:hypothetical protein
LATFFFKENRKSFELNRAHRPDSERGWQNPDIFRAFLAFSEFRLPAAKSIQSALPDLRLSLKQSIILRVIKLYELMRLSFYERATGEQMEIS